MERSDTRPVTSRWDTTYLLARVKAPFDKLNHFDTANEDWPQYEERLSYYFVANGSDSAEKKHAVLLTVIGATTYKLLCSFVVPSKPREELRRIDVSTVFPLQPCSWTYSVQVETPLRLLPAR